MKDKLGRERINRGADSTTVFIIDGREVKSTQLTYDQLTYLYSEYVSRVGRTPPMSDCKSTNNLPQPRRVKEILAANNVAYKEFVAQFTPKGEAGRIRASVKDYALYVDSFKKLFVTTSKGLWASDLTRNGLPCAAWLVNNCPDTTVKNYRDFCRWCGFEPVKKIYTKDEVSDLLRKAQDQLGHRLTTDDLGNNGTCHVSEMVIKRLFGSLNNAIEELGLIKDRPPQGPAFEYYADKLKQTLYAIKAKTGRTTVSWRDIENDLYAPEGETHTGHKAYQAAFRREGVDLFQFMYGLGFKMNTSRFSYCDTFPDGERVRSAMEYDVSKYLRTIGLKYNQEYFRDVKYRTFLNDVYGRIDCDYVVDIDGTKRYIEVAGIIYTVDDSADDWRTHQFSSERENEYRDKMVRKERLLIEAGVPFLFLFRPDMENDRYKAKIAEFLSIRSMEAA